MRRYRKLAGGFLAGALLIAAATVYALSATSPSYRLVETQAAAKGFATSASYKFYSSTGQPTPVGVTQGPSYKAEVGFLRRAALISGGAVPMPRLIDPDTTDDGNVRSGDITAVGNCYGVDAPAWATIPSCEPKDLNTNGVIRSDDISMAVNAYGLDNWPPFNSQTQPVTVPVGKTLRVYVLGLPDSNNTLPTLSLVGGVPGQSLTVDSTPVNGKRRRLYQWTPSAPQAATQLTIRATYGSSTSEISLWLKAQ